MQESQLQTTPHILTKVIQLYETKNSRHSVMIVGQSGSGKSVTWHALQAAMTRLKKKNVPGYNIVKVVNQFLGAFERFVCTCMVKSVRLVGSHLTKVSNYKK